MSAETIATAQVEQVAEANANVMAEKLQKEIKPEQAAEMVFRYYWPQYQRLVSSLSNKDARRLNEAVVGYPLEVTNKNFFSKEAKEAFALAKTLMDAKFILQQRVIQDAIGELENKNEETTVVSSETNETVNEGENANG
jgi:hypothetical protein